MDQDHERGVTMKLLFLFTLFWLGASENDRDFKMCGNWSHSIEKLTLVYDLKRGCQNITIFANTSSLLVKGSITAKCEQFKVVMLDHSPEYNKSQFCIYWEPLLDLLKVEVNKKNHTLCQPSGLQESCCTDLSIGANQEETKTYGILGAKIRGDLISERLTSSYLFYGEPINCKKEFCEKTSPRYTHVNLIEEEVLRSEALGNIELPCALTTVVEMNEGFQGYNVSLPSPRSKPSKKIPLVYLPSSLKPSWKKTAKVVCTFFNNSTFFQNSSVNILDDVVGITVENEVISSLSEPVRISFHHAGIPNYHSRKCVSWDTKKDPREIHWRKDGCSTKETSTEDTECWCYHLTYFAILVQVEMPATMRHLRALTFITAMGCAISTCSCVVLIVLQRRSKNKSTIFHRGLAMALFLLSLLFLLTGVMANVGGEGVCWIFGAALHYALLCSFSWMAIEVLHTFLMFVQVDQHSLKPYLWYLVGFGLPAVPVSVLLWVGNIYGLREIRSSDDINNPYLMCWMKDSNGALQAHYLINLGFLSVLFCSGIIMLYIIHRTLTKKKHWEWKKNGVTFISIWGLSCLYGTTWGLGFLNFGPISVPVAFLFCVLNSLQGFFLMLRFWALKRMGKNQSNLSGSSTGSAGHTILQEKS